MKKANNNEMDLVLRSLAKSRRDDPSVIVGSEGDSVTTDEHLDADELNTFAEGLAPEAARARYVKHLADCPSCRGLVVSLSQAAGVVNRSADVESKPRPGFWQVIAALFSAPVLRYAVPAVALVAVLGIGFLALRRDDGREFVAGKYGTSINSVPESPVTPQPATPVGQTALPSQSQVDSKTNTVPAREASNSQTNRSETAKVAENSDIRTAKTLKDLPAPPPASLDAGSAQPTFAPEPKMGAVASGRTTTSDAKKAAMTKEEQPADLASQQRQRDAFKNAEVSKEGEDKNTGLYNVSPSGPRRSDAPMTERRGYGAKSKSGSIDEDEVRSVAGRRFRRQGNGWVDTGYEGPRATISVARGSEQFRALVADEPGIGNVASQLEGDVIVIWKGKAYRIH